MTPSLSEDEIDDLLYFARADDLPEFNTLAKELCKRENISLSELLLVVKDEYSGNGPLHMAAANGHSSTLLMPTILLLITDCYVPETLRAILDQLSHPPQNPLQLALINQQNSAGNIALHWAALNGHLECVKALLDAGADPTIKNKAGHDVVYEAEVNDKTEVVEWVLKEGSGLEEGIGGSEGGGEGGDENMEEGEEEKREGDGVKTEDEVVKERLRDLDMADEMKGS
jgi:uncharacterized protein